MTSHTLLNLLLDAIQREQAAAANYAILRDTLPGDSATRAAAYRSWTVLSDATTRAFTMWHQAVSLEARGRPV